ncbi:MAG: aldo/keto reductase [Acidimicrobiia bacterium]
MEHRQIGELRVSLIGLGCNNFGRHLDSDSTKRVVDSALEHGVNFFDTADVYYGVEGSSEIQLGEALAGRRDQVIIGTKFGKQHPQGDLGWGGASPQWVKTAVENSLRRLRTDWIDLYQLHEPDPSVPIEETLGALDQLVEAGMVREIGHSGFSAEEMRHADAMARERGYARFESTQTQWNLLTRQAEEDVVPAAAGLGMAILPFFPLSSGLLTGKYRSGVAPDPSWRLAKIPNRTRFIDEERLRVTMDLERYAHDHGHSLLDLAFSWLASFEVVGSVIAGATRAEQVAANAVAANWHLSFEDLEEINQIAQAT